MRPEELRQRRLASGFTIADLAKESGISRATISKIENGYSQSTPLTLAKIEAALVHPCQELLDASRRVLRLWDNPQDFGMEVYTPAYENLRGAIEKAEG